MLQRAVCELLCHPDRAPDAFQGLVVLLAKEKVVTHPKQLRPIVLAEALTKLTARIAAARILVSWPLPPEMLGGRPGGQVAEAVWVAKRMFMRSAMFADRYVYLKVDISAAFDSLEHAAVQADMTRFFHPSHAISARFIDFLLLNQSLHFTALGCLAGEFPSSRLHGQSYDLARVKHLSGSPTHAST